MISIEVNARQLTALREACGKAKKKFAPELAGTVNQVSKKVKLQIGRDIRSVVTIKKKESEAPLSIRLKATAARPTAIVTLKRTKRLGMRHFGARQDKSGVSYKISKKGGRGRVEGAFMGPKPGVMKTSWRGNAFKRVGRARLPIVQIKGVSAWGAYVKNNFAKPQARQISEELKKQMERRINLNVLRASGLVST